MIDYHVDALRRAGVERIVVNLAWLGESIREYLGDGSRYGVELVFSTEPPGALETAGGIVHALAFLRGESFLLVNGDIYTDFDFSTLRRQDGLDVELVMVDNPAHNRQGDFSLANGRLVERAFARRALTYAGIGIFRRALFESLAPGRRPLKPVLDDAIRRQRAGGRHFRGLWMDIGTADRLAEADVLAASINQRQREKT